MKVSGLTVVLAVILTTIGCGSSNRFLYTVGPRTNSVLAFQQASTGALTALASGFSTDSQPVSVAILPSGIFAYTANFGAGNVSIFDRDNSSGTLKAATDPTTGILLNPVVVGINPIALVVSPNGQVVYVLNQGTTLDPKTNLVFASVSALTVDSTTGNLTVIGSPFPTPEGAVSVPVSITITADSRFLYVADSAQATIAGFLVNPNGSLTPMQGSPFSAGSGPAFAVTDPQARFLYVADPPTNQIFAFALDPTTGVPSPISGSPFPAGTEPVGLSIDSTGVLLVAANRGSNNISAYSIDTTTGALSQVSGSPFDTGTAPVFVVVDITNSFVYAADNGSNDIAAFGIIDGTLKSINGSPFSTATSPIWLTSR